MAAAPVGVEALLRHLQRPVFHAKERQRCTQVGTALLVVGHLVERLEVRHARHGSARGLHRFAGLEQIGVDLRQQHVGHRVLVVQYGRLLQGGQRVLVAAQLVVRHGGPGLGAGIAGLHHARPQERIQRGIRLPLLEVQQALACERHIVRRVVAQRGGKGLTRLGELVHKSLQRAQLAPSAGRLGRQLQRAPQVLAGGARVFALGMCTAQALPGACIARCERLGLGIGRQRAGRIAPAPGQLGADQRQVWVGRALRGGQGGSCFVHTVTQYLHPCQLRHQRRVGGPALERSA